MPRKTKKNIKRAKNNGARNKPTANRVSNKKLIALPTPVKLAILRGKLDRKRKGGKLGYTTPDMLDKIVELENKGLSIAQIEDMLSTDDNMAENQVIALDFPVFVPTLRKFAAGFILEAIEKRIQTVNQSINVPGVGDFSYGELGYIRLLYEILEYLNGRNPTFVQQHPTINRWIALLTPRVIVTRNGGRYALSWNNVNMPFNEFYMMDDLNPWIGNGVCIGKLETGGGRTFTRTVLPGLLTEAQILQYGTEAYMEIITQLGLAEGGLVDPFADIIEKHIAAAFSAYVGFGEPLTGKRFYATVRNVEPIDRNHLPYASTGFVDSSGLDVNEEIMPVRTTQFINVSHYYYQLSVSAEEDPRVAKDYLVYPKILSAEQICYRILLMLIVGDMRSTMNIPNFNSGSVNQDNNSIFLGMGNTDLTKYLISAVRIMMTKSWVGVFSLPQYFDGFCGNAFLPNALSRFSALPISVVENLETLGASKRVVQDTYNNNFTRVTVPILCSRGNFNCTFIDSNSLINQVQALFPGLNPANITFGFSSSKEVRFLQIGQISSFNPNSLEVVTMDEAFSNLVHQTSVAIELTQPSIVLAQPSNNHSCFTLDPLTLVVNVDSSETVSSTYKKWSVPYLCATHMNNWLITPTVQDIMPIFIIGELGADIEETKNSAMVVSVIFQQPKRIPFETLVGGLNVTLTVFDLYYPAIHVGSRFQPPQTEIEKVLDARIYWGDGSYLVALRVGLDATQTIVEVGADLLDYFENKDASKFLRDFNKGVTKARKYVPMLRNPGLHLNRGGSLTLGSSEFDSVDHEKLIKMQE